MKKVAIAALFIISACTSSKQIGQNNSPQNISVNGKIFASLYQQRAAEYRALCFQAFNLARLRIDEMLQTKNGKPRAIITDIDETVLDNSAYDLHRYLKGVDYEATSWHEWITMSKADTVPGAPAFLKYAAAKGITIFYITNRDEIDRAGTLLNLQKFNLPNADNAHLILREGISSKEARREKVASTHDVVMLLGDNLADFSLLFDKKELDVRRQNTDNVAGEFGKKFILIPNPVYGDWEYTVYKYSNTLTPAQKDSAIKSLLTSY